MTNFIIGATFNSTAAVKQLTEFITTVQAKARQASTAVTHALAGGAGPRPEGFIGPLSKEMEKFEKDSRRTAGNAAKDAKRATEANISALGASTKQVGEYGTAIGTASGNWSRMEAALKGYQAIHGPIMKSLEAQVAAYGTSVSTLATNMGTTSKDLITAISQTTKATKENNKVAGKGTPKDNAAARSLKEQEDAQNRVNNAVRNGVIALNNRLVAMKKEAIEADRVLDRQKQILATQKRRVESINRQIDQHRKLSSADKESADSIKRISQLQGRRAVLLERIKTSTNDVKDTKARISKIDSDIARATGNAAKQTLIAAGNLTTVVKRVALWSLGMAVIFGTLQKIKQSFSDVISLQDKMVQIAKIKPYGFDVDPLKKGALETAVKYGIAIENISETMRVFAQQGKGTGEILELIDVSAKGVIATNLTMRNSVELLTAAMNIFKVSGSEVETVLDKIQNVQANYAVTAEDLADAMRLLGPIVKTLGSDMDFLFGSVTAVSEATRQTGKFVGNALKTIFARLPKKDSLFLLNSLGVTLYDMAGNVRPLDKVLGDLAGKWDTLTDSAKLNLATTVGGVRRYNVFITLMNNWNRVVSASATSLDSVGAATEAVGKEQDSLQRKLNKVRERFRKIGIEVLEGVVPPLVGLAETLSVVTKSWAVQGAVAVAAAVGIVKLATALKSLQTSMLAIKVTNLQLGILTSSLAGIPRNMYGMIRAGTTFSALGKALSLSWASASFALKSFAATVSSTVLPLAILVGSVTLITKAYKRMQNAAEKTRQFQEGLIQSAKRFNSIGIDFEGISGLPTSFAGVDDSLTVILSGLDALGIKAKTATGGIHKLDSAMVSFVKGFSTEATVKALESGVERIQVMADRMSKTFARMASSDGPSKTGKAVGEGFWRYFTDQFASSNRTVSEVKAIFEKVLNEAAVGIKADDPAAQIIGAIRTSFRTEKDVYGVERLTFDYDALAAAARNAGVEVNKYGTVTKIVSGLADGYADVVAESIVLKQKEAKITSKQVQLQGAQVDLEGRLIRKVIEKNIANDEGNSLYTQQLRVLLRYRQALQGVIESAKSDIDMKKDMEKYLLSINATYLNLLTTLDKVDEKTRISAATNKLLGLGFDSAASNSDNLKAKIEAYITVLESAQAAENKFARQDALASTQRELAQGTQTLIDGAIELAKSGTQETLEQLSDENLKARDAAVQTSHKLVELYHAWKSVAEGLGGLDTEIAKYVDLSDKAGEKTNDWGVSLYEIGAAISANARAIRDAATAGKYTNKSIDLISKAYTGVRDVIGNLAVDIAKTEPEFGAVEKRLEEVSSSLKEQEALQKKLKAQIDFRVDGSKAEVGLRQQLLTVEARIRDLIYEENYLSVELYARGGALLKQRSRLAEGEAEFLAIQERILDNSRIMSSLSAAQLKSDNDAQAAQLKLSAKIARLSGTNLRNIELTTQMYNQQRDAIIQSGIEEAKRIGISKSLSGEQFIAQDVALQLSEKKKIELTENELAKLTALRELRESAITEQYGLQIDRMEELGDNISGYYKTIGDLLTAPIAESIDLAGSLSFKIRQNTKLFGIQAKTQADSLNAQINNIDALTQAGLLTSEIADTEKRRLNSQHAISLALIEYQRELEQINIENKDHVAGLEKTVSTYQDIKKAIISTATSFDALIEDAHVFRNLFDEIGNIYFKKGIESIFDKVFETGDDNIAKILDDGFMEGKIRLLVESDSLDSVNEAIRNSYAAEHSIMQGYINQVTAKIDTLAPSVVENMTLIGDTFYQQTLKLLQGFQEAAAFAASQIAEHKYNLDDTLKGKSGLTSVAQEITAAASLSVEASKVLSAAVDTLTNRLNANEKATVTAAKQVGKSAESSEGVSAAVATLFSGDSLPVTVVGIDDLLLGRVAEAIKKVSVPPPTTNTADQNKRDNNLADKINKGSPFANPKLQAGISLASLAAGSSFGVNTGRGISSGAGLASSIGTLLGVSSPLVGGAMAIGGALLGGIFGNKRDKQEDRARRAEEARIEKERKLRELEAARNRAAILDAAERTVQNTDPMRSSTLFAPTGFRIPSYAFQGGGLPGGSNNTFNINVPLGAEARNVAAEIARHVDGNYTDESARQSSNSDSYL